jgi:prolyl-tRNA editing enzyme YbaK/EbsC (Cys-tRNA(Pro) deacylase)
MGLVKATRVLADRSKTGNDVVRVAAGAPDSELAIQVGDVVRLSQAVW